MIFALAIAATTTTMVGAFAPLRPALVQSRKGSLQMAASSSSSSSSSSFHTGKALTAFVVAAGLFAQKPANAAIPVLEAATRAMLETKEKETEKEREFDSLPDGAKRRFALNLCKDSSARSAAGYSGAAACTEDVFKGNFKNIVEGVPIEGAAPASKRAARESSSSSGGSSSASAKASSASASSRKVAKDDGPLTKVNDLSDLTPAAKKRRSLAACKKSAVRAFAKVGSEDKCTKNVLAGDYDKIIEALEYGKGN